MIEGSPHQCFSTEILEPNLYICHEIDGQLTILLWVLYNTFSETGAPFNVPLKTSPNPPPPMYSWWTFMLTPVANKDLGMTGIFVIISNISRLARWLTSDTASELDKQPLRSRYSIKSSKFFTSEASLRCAAMLLKSLVDNSLIVSSIVAAFTTDERGDFGY